MPSQLNRRSFIVTTGLTALAANRLAGEDACLSTADLGRNSRIEKEKEMTGTPPRSILGAAERAVGRDIAGLKVLEDFHGMVSQE